MNSLVNLINKIEKLPALIEGATVEWVGSSSEKAICIVEEALGVQIKGSFREFLLIKGGGGLDSFSISGIPQDNPFLGLYSDTIYYRENSWAHKLPQHLIVIERDVDDNEPFCIDTSKIINNENPVVLYYHQSTGIIEKVAPSFLNFYESYLNPYFEDAGI